MPAQEQLVQLHFYGQRMSNKKIIGNDKNMIRIIKSKDYRRDAQLPS
jgi:hypothetical protein